VRVDYCRWLALPSQKDFISPALSNTACEMLRVLKDHLHQMQTLLSKSLFNEFWQHVATRLNQYILTEVRSITHRNNTNDLFRGRRTANRLDNDCSQSCNGALILLKLFGPCSAWSLICKSFGGNIKKTVCEFVFRMAGRMVVLSVVDMKHRKNMMQRSGVAAEAVCECVRACVRACVVRDPESLEDRSPPGSRVERDEKWGQMPPRHPRYVANDVAVPIVISKMRFSSYFLGASSSSSFLPQFIPCTFQHEVKPSGVL